MNMQSNFPNLFLVRVFCNIASNSIFLSIIVEVIASGGRWEVV